MATVTNPNLTLTTVNNTSTTLTVTYNVEFDEVERNLVSLGVNGIRTSTSSATTGQVERRCSSTTRSTTKP